MGSLGLIGAGRAFHVMLSISARFNPSAAIQFPTPIAAIV
jgi:hypothetical protein